MKNTYLNPSQFQELGNHIIDRLSHFLNTIEDIPLTKAENPEQIQNALGLSTLPINGEKPEVIVNDILDKLLNHSLYNGHPGFMGYITSSPLPIGALADLIASTINQNVGGYRLAPMASEIERQSIQWLAEFLNYNTNCGGIFVSGGNMANFLGFLVARTIKGPKDVQTKGLKNMEKQLTCYASIETHTWIQKASDLFGIGSDAVRWIPTNENREMDVLVLESEIKKDMENGMHPFLVVGTGGSVSFGVVDPMQKISKICKKHDLWFHIDGAYGAPAAASQYAPASLKLLHLADSVAVDPHKWLYSPLEVGCTLVKDPLHLRQTFSHNPAYYDFANSVNEIDYHEYGMQNSRGFRALKVWMGFKLLGKEGAIKYIDKDIEHSRLLFKKIDKYENISTYSNNLSITTFRYIPTSYLGDEEKFTEEINDLNKTILHQIFLSGKAFVSNAMVGEIYLLRACLVNFRTQEKDLDLLLEMVDEFGEDISS